MTAAAADVEGLKRSLRARLRSRRAELSSSAVAAAGEAAAARLANLPVVRSARLLAGYRAVRGEVPLDALTEAGLRGEFSFPRVVGDDLEFVPFTTGQSLASGAFAIPEPCGGVAVPLVGHDVVFVPLVAFDQSCRRLGQGRGFYDRALSSARAAARGRAPVSVGVAHWFQQVDEVPCDSLDVALDAVVTDRATWIGAHGALAGEPQRPSG